jgi:hypothetical protein
MPQAQERSKQRRDATRANAECFPQSGMAGAARRFHATLRAHGESIEASGEAEAIPTSSA